MNFILRDALNNPLVNQYSSYFQVFVGVPFKLSFFTPPGTSTGGANFSPFPVLAITDRGSNTVPSVNAYTVKAFLTDNTQNVNLLPLDQTTQSIVDGYALFRNLYIQQAGNYIISFQTNMVCPTFVPYANFY